MSDLDRMEEGPERDDLLDRLGMRDPVKRLGPGPYDWPADMTPSETAVNRQAKAAAQ